MITGIILASGFSNRMGQNKLLIEVEGIKVIERVISACKNSLLDEIILIYRVEELKELGKKYGIKTVYNPNAHLGQSAAVKLGVESSKDLNSFMFIVGDQPYLDTNVINKTIEEYRKDANRIVVPYYNQKFGMPIIFPNCYKTELLNVKGDKGGREIIDNNIDLVNKVYIDNELLGIDIDTIDDLEKIQQR